MGAFSGGGFLASNKGWFRSFQLGLIFRRKKKIVSRRRCVGCRSGSRVCRRLEAEAELAAAKYSPAVTLVEDGG